MESVVQIFPDARRRNAMTREYQPVGRDKRPRAVADLPPLIKAAGESYMRGDYEAARQSYGKAWELVQQTPPANPVRYDVLKRLTSVRAAAGEFADADNYLQMAINWRETIVGPSDP